MDQKWRDMFAHLPGYDPVATAGDCVFDSDRAQQAIDFFGHPIDGCLRHAKGVLAGKRFVLEPWQAAIVSCLFGWLRPDGTRRYRESFIYVPRKNGKTTLAAGLLLYVLVSDGEPGAEIYGIASEYKQACFVFEQASGMVRREPELHSRLTMYHGQSKAIVLKSDPLSSYRVLSSGPESKHGGNTHFAVVDELHTFQSRELVDVIESSVGSRTQPLLVYITTADFDRPGSICNEKLSYACKVRDRVIENDEFLPVVFAASHDDDWRDPQTWRKANPNLGVSIQEEFLEKQCKKAIELPGYENTFKRLYLNMRTEQDVQFVPLDRWRASSGLSEGETPGDWRHRTLERLRRCECYVGLDLSSKIDITATVLIFPPSDLDGDVWTVIPYFWVPEERVAIDSNRDTYQVWVRDGWITASPGSEIDLQGVRRLIGELNESYPIREVAYDPWGATELRRQLEEEDGFAMVEIRQGSKSLSEPLKKIEALALGQRIHHGNNPVLEWMLGNVAIKEDENGNKQPNKKRSTGKIDGIVALATGMARALLCAGNGSPYDDPENDSIELFS